VLVAAARRFASILAIALAVTAPISLLLGLATGASVSRALSLGLYGMGSFLLVAGFFVGNRGPARLVSDADAGPFPLVGNRRIRWATREEHHEVINSSAVFVALGFALVLLGVVVDSRYELL
jgi:hypothetical protein